MASLLDILLAFQGTNLPPFVLNGEGFYLMPRLDPTLGDPIISEYDVRRKAREAWLVWNRDPSAPWRKHPGAKYPELIEDDDNELGGPVIAHPVQNRRRPHKTDKPKACRVRFRETNPDIFVVVFHDLVTALEVYPVKVAEAKADAKKHTKEVYRLRAKLDRTRGETARAEVQKDLDKAAADRSEAQRQANKAPPTADNAAFSKAVHIPAEPSRAVVAQLIDRYQPVVFDSTERTYTVGCANCGETGKVSETFLVVTKCKCLRAGE